MTGTIILTVQEGFISDVSGNPYNTTESFIYTMQPPDVTAPTLLTFDLDMNTGTLQLTFSEPVYIVNVSGLIQLVNSSGLNPSGEHHNLTDMDTVFSFRRGPLPTWELQLGTNDLNALKVNRRLCTTRTDTFISLPPGLVVDRRDNPIVAQGTAIRVSLYINDLLPPYVTNISLDLSSELLVVQFSEPIVTQTLNYSTIFLTSSTDTLSGISIAGSDIVASNVYNTNITINLSQRVINSIKLETSLCSNITTCYLYHSAESYHDTSGNHAVGSTEGLQMSSFTPDYVRPVLLSYILDLNLGVLEMTFSEPVRIYPMGGYLQNRETNSSEILSFSPTNISLITPVNAVVHISEIDDLKLNTNLGTNQSNTFLLLNTSFAEDYNGNLLLASRTGVQTQNVIPDTSRPTLDFFMADFNLGIITLQFSETVVLSSLDRQGIELGGGIQRHTSTYALNSSILTEDNYTQTVTVTLPKFVLDSIKSDTQVCSSEENCHVFLPNGTVQDISGNLLLSNFDGMIASSFTPDSTGPQLTAYDIDLDSGSMVVYFDEPVNVLSFRPSLLSFTDNHTSLQHSLDGSIIDEVAPILSDIRLNLTLECLNYAKVLAEPALAVDSVAVEDTSGNPVVSTNVRVPSTLAPDSTPPRLIQFLPQMSDEMVLVFDEIVNASSWNGYLVTLTLEVSAGDFVYRNLMSGMLVTNVSLGYLTYIFSGINNTPTFTNLYTEAFSNGTIILTVQEGFISDVSGNPYNTTESFIYTMQPPDVTAPTLLTFDLDMNTGTLQLTFSEPVYIVNVSGLIQLVNSSGLNPSGEHHNLTDMDTVFSFRRGPLPTWELQLGTNDLNALKVNRRLCTTRTDTFISLPPGLVVDRRDNPIVAQGTAIRVSLYINDLLPPYVTNVSLDLSSELLVVQFSEPIVTQSLNYSTIFLTSSTDTLSGISIAGSDIVASNVYNTNITINLSQRVINSIKLETSLCSNITTCYLYHSAESYHDTSGNHAVGSTEGLQMSSFTPDYVRPVVLSYILDLNLGVLEMTFSEPVRIYPMGGYLQNRETNSSEILSFTPTNISLITPVNVVVHISEIDDLKLNTNLGTNQSNTFLLLNTSFAEDYNGNLLLASRTGVQAQNVIPDTSRPTLDFFMADFNLGIITLQFSETIALSSLDRQGIELGGGIQRHTSTYALNSSILTEDNYTQTVTVTLPKFVLDSIKSDTQVCSSEENCHVFLPNGTVQDISGNLLLSNFDGMIASSFTPDSTGPQLTAYDIDLDSGSMVVYFDEPVNVLSFRPSLLSFTDNHTSLRHSLNGSIIDEVAPILSDIRLNLTLECLNYAKVLAEPVLAVDSVAVEDTSGNPVVSTNVRVPSTLAPDSAPPRILQFLPQMSDEIILVFDEIVNASSWNGNLVTLTLEVSAGDFVYGNLMSGMLVTNVSLSHLTYIFSSINNTPIFTNLYTEAFSNGTIILTVQEGFISDVSGNPYNTTESFIYTMQPPDVTAPTLLTFDLDMNTGTLQLTFSEPVYIVNVSGLIQLVNSSGLNPSGEHHNLTDMDTVFSFRRGPLPTWELQLGTNDLNALKVNRRLCTSHTDTFISLPPGLVVDRSGNSFQLRSNATPVHIYTPDINLYNITQFDLDLNLGEITVHFSEPILEESVLFSSLGIANSAFSQGIVLFGSTILKMTHFQTQITIQLSNSTLNRIKFYQSICTTVNDCYLNYDHSTFLDTSGNRGYRGEANIQATHFTNDTTGPLLLSFSLDLNYGRSVLTFDEPVNIATLNLTGLAILARCCPFIATESLSGAFVEAMDADNTVIRIALANALNHLKRQNAYDPSKLALSVTSSAAEDLYSNPVTPVPISSPIAVSGFVPDSTPPCLLQFIPGTPNLTDITLVFSEYVNGSSLNEDHMNISLTTRQGSFLFSAFSGGMITSDLITDRIVYSFSEEDERHLTESDILSEAIAIGLLTLQIGHNFITDLNENPIAPSASPLQYTTDDSNPFLSNFTLDLNSGVLFLSFSEPVFLSPSLLMGRLQSGPVDPLTVIGFHQNSVSSLLSELHTINIDPIKDTLQIDGTIGSSPHNTFLVLEETFARDLSGNFIQSLQAGIRAHEVIPDSSSPQLESFSIDINRGEVRLQFSETIRSQTLNTTLLFFTESIQGQHSQLNLTGSNYSGENLLQTVSLRLSRSLLDDIKSNQHICSLRENCVLFISAGAVEDIAGNVVSSISLAASSLIKDNVRPELVAYDIDLDSGIVVLTFNEPIDSALFNVSSLTLNGRDTSQEEVVNGTILEDMMSIRATIRLGLNNELLNYAKLLQSPHLAVSSTVVADAAGNQILPTNTILPDNLVPDSTHPRILVFISGKARELTLVFNEVVNTTSWNGNLVTLTLEVSAGDFVYRNLTSGVLVTNVSLSHLTYIFSSSDNTPTFTNLYTEAFSNGTIILTVQEGFISDVSGNPYNTTESFIYTMQPPDVTAPTLLTFDLDMNTGTLQLTFSEPVYIVNVSGLIQLVNSSGLNPSGEHHNLTDMDTVFSFRRGPLPTWELQLGTNDLNALKVNRRLCTSHTDTFISLPPGLVVDRRDNPIVAQGTAIRVSLYINDLLPPYVTNVALDLSSELLVIQFSEPIVTQSLNYSTIFLTSSTGTLSGISIAGSDIVASNVYNTNITINLSQRVINSIKLETSLCSNITTCYLYHSAESYHDTSGNHAVGSTEGLQMSSFTPDYVRPVLLSYILDLNLGVLEMTFSEPVRIYPMGGYLQNRETNSSEILSFTPTNISLITPVNVVVHISEIDDLKLNTNLGTNQSNTFLLLNTSFAEDYNGNLLLASRTGVQAQNVIPDTSRPTLDFFMADFNLGIITLQFSETIALSSLDRQGIELGGGIQRHTSTYALNSSILTEDNYTQTVTVTLPKFVLDSIKSDTQVCSSEENCHVFLPNGTVQDISGNLLLSNFDGMIASSFTPDSTGPQLTAYDIDLDSGSMVVYFDEPVNVLSFRPSLLSFTDNHTSLRHSLNGSIIDEVAPILSDIRLNLTLECLNYAKVLAEPVLAVDSVAVVDTSGNPVISTNVRVPSTLAPDSAPPRLIQFLPQMSDEMVLVFDEIVNASSWNGYLVTLTLEVSAGDFVYRNLMSGMLVTNVSLGHLTYIFSGIDNTPTFTNLYTEAFSNGTIILTVQEGFISDVSGNPYNNTESFIYTMQPPDVTAPTLLTFDLDMNTGTLQLTFSEPVYIVNVSGLIQLVNSSGLNPSGEHHNLTDMDTVFSFRRGPLPTWELQLGTNDLNALKVNRRLCTTRTDTFISLPPGLAVDRRGNYLQETPRVLQVNMFTPDSVPPRITQFHFNLNTGEISIQFSEPILSESFNIFLFSLISETSSDRISLTDSIVADVMNLDTGITLSLPSTTLTEIDFRQSVCSTMNNCRLHYRKNSFVDTNENTGSVVQTGIQVYSFTTDSTGPELLSYSLDLNSGTLILSFNEPMNTVTFNPTGLAFVNTHRHPSGRLSDVFVTQVETQNTVLHLTLGSISLNQVKWLNTFNSGNLTLSVTSSAAEDLYSNPVTPVPINSPIPVSEFVPDSTPPRLLQFIPGTPNLTDITLMFSEYVNGSSLNEDHMNISLTTRQGSFLFSAFSGGMITSDLITDRIVYSLSEEDQHRLTESDVLSAAISSGSLELQIGHEFVTDLNNNALIPDPTPLRFTTDSTRPVLLNYTLDLDGGLLELGFSEPVFLSPPAVMGRFQSSPDPEEVITFFQHEISSLASETQTISISAILDHLLLDENIGSSPNNTYLTMQEEFARDLSGHFVQPSLNLQAYNVIADTSRPRLMAFTADMNTSEMTLHFSETVRTLSLDTSLLYLTMSRYNLTGSIATGENFTTTLTLNLHEYLLNAIKSDPLICSNKTNCVMFVRSAAVQDIAGNGITPSNAGIIASTFIPDSTSPELREYTIDLDHGSMIIDMTEPVNVSSLRLSQLILVGSDVNQHQPLNGTILEADPILKTSIELSLDTISLNHAKSLLVPNLAILGGAIEDAAGNPILPVDVVSPSNIVPDSTPPTLINFTPAGARAIGLFYDEAVRTDDWNGNLVSMLLEISAGNIEYTIGQGTLEIGLLANQIVHTFSETTYTPIFASHFTEATLTGTIILTVQEGFISDVSGNPYNTTESFIYTMQPPDVTAPTLLTFDLDMNTGTLQLTFSEPVYIVNVSGLIQLVNSSGLNPSGEHHNLTDMDTVFSFRRGPLPTWELQLGTNDLNALKVNRRLCTTRTDTFISLPPGLVVDRRDNPIVAQGTAIRVSLYINDLLPPYVTNISLDLSSELLVVQFSEPIVTQSLNYSTIFLTSSTDTLSGISIAGSDIVASNVYNTNITINLSQRVINSIKLETSLCSNITTCYLYHSAESYHDTSGNHAVGSTEGLQMSSFTPDYVRPVLLSYILDLNLGVLEMTFSEPVRIYPMGGYLQNRETNSSEILSFSPTNISLITPVNVVVHISEIDDLKLNTNLGTNQSNTFLLLNTSFAEDYNGNLLLASRTGVQAQNVIPDTSRPTLDFFMADFNLGIITLQFSETIALSSLDRQGIELGGGIQRHTSTYALNSSILTEDNYTQTVTVTLPKFVLDSIKSDTQVCSSEENCHVFLPNGTVQDISGNLLLSNFDGMIASSFTPDSTGPQLTAYDIDLDSGSMVVYFDEPVNVLSFRPSLLSFTDNHTSLRHSLNGSIIDEVAPILSDIRLNLTLECLNYAKVLAEPVLTVDSVAVVDTSGNPVVSTNVRVPSTLAPDSAPPRLIQFLPQMSDEMVLVFDEIVNASSWNGYLVTLTLEVSAGDFVYRNLMSGMLVTNVSLGHLTYIFSGIDNTPTFTNLYTEAFSNGTIILTVQEGFISDVSGNPYNNTESFIYTMQPPDVTAPTLLTFDLDMNTGTLQLTFSEPVYIVNVSGLIQLVNSSGLNPSGEHHNLTDMDTVFSFRRGPLPTWELQLGTNDLNALKVNRRLCTTRTDTFISLPPGLAVDRRGNYLQETPRVLQVNMFTPDSVPPRITQFHFNLNTGEISIQFSEPILSESFNIFLFCLISETSDRISLTDSIVADVMNLDTGITLSLPSTTLTEIDFRQSVCSTMNNCRLHYRNNSFVDTNENTGSVVQTGIQVYSFTTDSTGPELLSYSLDLNSGTLILSFNEPMNTVTFNPTGLAFVNTHRHPSGRLSDVFVTQVEAQNTVLHLTLGSISLNQVKWLNTFNSGNLTLSVTSSAAEDLYSNPVTPVPINSPIPVSEFVPDSTPPRLLQFIPGTPNLTDITLMFSEYVNGSSLNEDHMNISLTTRQGSFLFSAFSGGMITSDLITDRIVYSFSEEDERRLTENRTLSEGIEFGLVLLYIGQNFIYDLSNNLLLVNPIPLRHSFDHTLPNLLNFSLDLNSGSLHLSFSEYVFLSSPVLIGHLQNSAVHPAATINFIQNRYPSEPSELHLVFLNSTVLLNLQMNNNLASTRSNTFLVLGENFAEDLSGNAIQSSTIAIQADAVIPDTSGPMLVSFIVDMNRGEIILEFSEIVSSLSLNTSLLHLSNLNLSSSEYSGENFVHNMLLSIPDHLLNQIKSNRGKCSSRENCVLYIASGAVEDVVGNALNSTSNGTIPSYFIPDTTRPELTRYEINLNSGLLLLLFDEPVDSLMFQTTSLTFISTDTSREQTVNATVLGGTGSILDAISLNLTLESLNFAKLLVTPHLIINSTAVSDAAGNPVIPTNLSPSLVVPDSTSPRLKTFIPDGESELVLIFDEVVDTNSWSGVSVSLIFEVSTGNFEYSNFTTGMVVLYTYEKIAYIFSVIENGLIFADLFTEAFSNGTIILTVQEGFISDVSGNPYNNTESFIYTMQPPDVTAPTLLTFDLDMNTGTLQLTFSEPVYIVNVSGLIQLVNSSGLNPSGEHHNLTDMDTVFSFRRGPLPTWELQLGTNDLNALKVNRRLCTTRTDTFISLPPGLAVDRRGNYLQETPRVLQVNMFTPDSVPPRITQFHFNLDAGEISLNISEPVFTESFNFSLITLEHSFNSINNINLTGSTIVHVTNFKTEIRVLLSNVTLNRIKYLQSLCTGVHNCHLRSENNSFTDTSYIIGTTDIESSSFTPDTSGPSVLINNLDLNNGLVVVIFDEPIDTVTFNSSGLLFINPRTRLGLNLSNATIMQTESRGTVINLILENDAFNKIKQLNAYDPSNLALSVTSSAAEDLYSNPVTPVPISSPIAVSEFVPDSTPPHLLQFIPGISNLTDITLVFSEYINGSSLNEDHMNISLTTRQGSFLFSAFSGGTITSDLITDHIVYSFSEEDLHRLTESDVLSHAISSGLLELQIGHEFVTDLNNNALIPDPTPLRFTTDSTRPVLLNYTLNLDGGFLDLTFSEPVFLYHMNGRGRLQNLIEHPDEFVTFTGSGGLIPASNFLRVYLDIIDDIKINPHLASSRMDTYLLLEETFAEDVSGNLLLPRSTGLQAQDVILDTIGPSLESFIVNVNEGNITLDFSESIAVTSLNTARMYISGTIGQSARDMYSLTDSVVVEMSSQQTVTLMLSQTLLNSIKSNTEVCSSASNCNIFFDQGAVTDITGNTIRDSYNPILASSFVADTSPPELESYSMDLNTGMVYLSFTEPIQSLNPSTIKTSVSSLSQPFADATVAASDNHNTAVTLSMGDTLLNQMKLFSSLGPISLSLAGDTAVDTSHINIRPMSNLAASTFRLDTTPPTLLQFQPSSEDVRFTLIFDEYVTPASLQSDLLRIKLRNSLGTHYIRNLSNFHVSTNISNTLILSILSSTTVLENLLEFYTLTVDEGSICFSLAPHFVSDISGNGYMGDHFAYYSAQTGNDLVDCRVSCPPSTFENNLGNCQPCHDQCSEGCNGPGPSNCVSCREKSEGTECVPFCPIFHVYDEENKSCYISE